MFSLLEDAAKSRGTCYNTAVGRTDLTSVNARVRMALFFAHPGWLIAVAGAGAILAIEHGLANKLSATELRTSLTIAVLIGMPAVLITKRMVRLHMDFYSEYCFQIGDRAAQVEFWKQNWKNLSANLPLTVAITATGFAAKYLRVHWLPMLGMMLILCLLLYPEQEEVYRRIRQKIVEMGKEVES